MSEVHLRRKSPAELVEDWPRRQSSNVAVEIARQIVLHLHAASERLGADAFAEMLGASEGELRSVVEGRNWPPIVLVNRAEQVLGIRVCPRL